MKIYVASSWRNPFQPEVVKKCRREGHEVYDFRNPKEGNHGFAWSDIDPNWENWTTPEYTQALLHPIAVEGFALDMKALEWANCCILVLPSGRSAHVEAGWVKGQGHDVYVYSPIDQEPELMYKMFDGIIANPSALELLLKELPK